MISKKMKEMEESLLTGEVYHIFSKSKSGFQVFRSDADYARMKDLLRYYNNENPPVRFSYFARLKRPEKKMALNQMNGAYMNSKGTLVEIMAYCIVPNNIHLILKQKKDKGISTFMGNVLNSYTRYFNVKYNRKGALWEGRFKRTWIRTYEQFLEVSRFVHLSPVISNLVHNVQDWEASSYREYLGRENKHNSLCRYKSTFKVEPVMYKKFVEEDFGEIKELWESII